MEARRRAQLGARAGGGICGRGGARRKSPSRLHSLGVGPGTRLACFLSVHLSELKLQRCRTIVVPSPEFEAYNWTA